MRDGIRGSAGLENWLENSDFGFAFFASCSEAPLPSPAVLHNQHISQHR